MERNISAAILAGGKNSRMGKDKAFIRINGVTLVQKTVTQLRRIFKEVVIVTNSPRKYEPYKKHALIVTDIIKNKGPLSGIHSALSQITHKSVFFVACDMPFLHNDMIERLLIYFNNNECDALVPKIGTRIEPLHAIYKTRLKGNLEYFLKNSKNYSVRNFLQTVNTKYMELEDVLVNRHIFKNINSPSDLKNIKK
ncbi:MAG: molybdenum cofactor guanylyltransferase [Candidatus Omnitrophota bacterium]